MRKTIKAKGLFCSLYTDRGSHYWDTPAAGGKVDRDNPTQFGRAMARLGIEMIPAYSPEARGRSERAFRTHQGPLPKELAAATSMEAANRYLREVYLPAFNAEFARPARKAGSAFVPCRDLAALDDILCEIHQRTVGRDNCVRFEQLSLQLPADRHRPHYVKARVKVRRHADGALSVWHGPRELARYRLRRRTPGRRAAGRRVGRGRRGVDTQAMPVRPRCQTGQSISSRTGHFYLFCQHYSVAH